MKKWDNGQKRRNIRAQYLGLLVISAELQDKKGSFILRDEGVFENGIATSSLKIMPGSGTNDFTGIAGEGIYKASHTNSILELNITL
ncbi:MAG: DUF3224 domain-containing protein [Pseudomonadota bacterium]